MFAFAGGLRVHCFLLTRKIHAVLSGLARVRVDQTTEHELLKTIPYLVREAHEWRTPSGVKRVYIVHISNENETAWLWRLADIAWFRLRWPFRETKDLVIGRTAPFAGAYWLGWHNVDFSAWVWIEDGRVSSVGYDIDPDMMLGWPHGGLISVRSAHGFWMSHFMPVSVRSADDESPDYRVSGGEGWLQVAYTPDAPRELMSRAFQLDLSCFWGIHRCILAREVAPLLWRDKQAIEARAFARFYPQRNPCPDSMLAARVRYLPDLSVELLEVTSSRHERVNEEGDTGEALITSYRLKEVIRGRSSGPWTDIRYRRLIPLPADPTERTANPVPPFLKPGDRVLAFTGAKFESCRMVPATPSAEAAVRTATPAPRRREDEVQPMRGNM
jgi:hypothetical protein